jgi:hypothetical protein
MRINAGEPGAGPTTEPRFAGLLSRAVRRDGPGEIPMQAPPGVHNGSPVVGTHTMSPDPLGAPASTYDALALPSLEAQLAGEPTVGGSLVPVHQAGAWMETADRPLSDHPLLRSLLDELPPKGTTPPAEWMDRWFEATRSVLDLLYEPRHYNGQIPNRR